MTEKPRDYKRKVDAEWKKNERNKNKLIKKIKEYELFDEKYKKDIERKVLKAFSEKEKEEKGGYYDKIVKVIEDVDKKYEDLDERRNVLRKMEGEKEKKIEEIKQCKLDVKDNTTLDIQLKHLENLERELNAINYDMEEVMKEIADKEEEIRVMEDNYWKRSEDEIFGEVEDQEDIVESNNVLKWNLDGVSLKEFREETLKDLRGKDRLRKEIIGILEKWVWIWNEFFMNKWGE